MALDVRSEYYQRSKSAEKSVKSDLPQSFKITIRHSFSPERLWLEDNLEM